MSTALAIASVTAVLKSLLENRLMELGAPASVGDVTVTALPPDRITTGTDERSQLNLFLYRVSPNTRWRRSEGNGSSNGHGGKDGVGELAKAPAAPSPLALDLHYLLTAYGEQDLHAEILLGYGMQLLHEVPVLTRDQIEGALARLNGARDGARGSDGLTEQMEQIQVAPEFSSTEETSRLWSALQARYRPSAAYKVSTVLIDSGGTPERQRSAEPAGKASSPSRRR
jgi:hypothetical protein